MGLSDAIAGQVSVSLETAAGNLPDMSYSPGGPPNPVMAWLRPRVIVSIAGQPAYTSQPWGAPPPPLDLLGLALVAVGVFLVPIALTAWITAALVE